MLLRDKENEDWKAATGQDGTVINLRILGDRKETNKSGTGFKDLEVIDNFGKDQVEGENNARLQVEEWIWGDRECRWLRNLH